MKKYIALLRGINVSGHKIIKMELLRKAFLDFNFVNVQTYIQSGNVIFESEQTDIQKLEQKIADLIETHFGFVVPVIVTTPGELKTIIEKNPYTHENPADATQPYVSFLSKIPDKENLQVLKAIDFGIDKFTELDNVLYLWYGTTAGNSKLSNTVIENKLKLRSTARNWKTVLKLYELATPHN